MSRVIGAFCSIFFKKKYLYKNIIIYGFSGALSRFSALIAIPIYTRLLPVSEYGVLDLYVTIGALIFIILETQMVSGFMRSYYESESKGCLSECLGSVVCYYILSSLFGFGIIGFFVIFSSFSHANLLFAVGLAVFPKQLFELASVVMRMKNRAKTYFLLNISNVLCMMLFGIASLTFIAQNPGAVLWGFCFSSYLFGLISFLYINRVIGIDYSFSYFKELFFYSAPILPAVLGIWGISSIGRLFVASDLPPDSLGIYSLATKVGMLFLLFSEAFRLAWQPVAIKKFSESEEKAKVFFSKAFSLYLITGLLIVVVLSFFSPYIVNLLAPSAYATAAPFGALFLLAAYFNSTLTIAATGNSWARKTYFNSIGSISGALLVLLLTWLLIPYLGMQGAALSQIIGSLVSPGLTLFFANKNVPIPYNKKAIAFILIASMIYCLYYLN